VAAPYHAEERPELPANPPAHGLNDIVAFASALHGRFLRLLVLNNITAAATMQPTAPIIDPYAKIINAHNPNSII